MTTETMENIVTLSAVVARASPYLAPGNISTNLLKILRLSKTLETRYKNTLTFPWAKELSYQSQTQHLERKASSLAQEIGLKLKTCPAAENAPVILSVNGYEWGIG